MNEYLEAHSVYLGWTNYELKVSAEGYKQILEIIRATAVCKACKQHYSAECPNVAGLLCLPCFVQQHQSLTFQGPLDDLLTSDEPEKERAVFQPDERVRYFFLNNEGHVYITDAGPGAGEESRESRALTLHYWHFPRPEQAERNGQTVRLGESGWSIYGNPKTDHVLVLQHGSTWHGDESLFIAKRGGPAIQINRRKPMHRALLAAARQELEATRTPGDMYLVDGDYQSVIHESDIYRLVARHVGESLTVAQDEAEQEEEQAPC